MTISMLKGKIHRATVTQAELDYVGSITVDIQLLEDAGIFEYEKVQIVDVNNGARFETYTIAGERSSGVICLNGAAARMVQTNDKVIIMAYADVTPEEANSRNRSLCLWMKTTTPRRSQTMNVTGRYRRSVKKIYCLNKYEGCI